MSRRNRMTLGKKEKAMRDRASGRLDTFGPKAQRMPAGPYLQAKVMDPELARLRDEFLAKKARGPP